MQSKMRRNAYEIIDFSQIWLVDPYQQYIISFILFVVLDMALV